MFSSCLFLIFMGSMDCLTTVVGAMFFGAREANPVLAGLVNSNLSGFVVVKFAVTVTVSLIFILAQKTLMRTSDQSTNAYKIALRILKIAFDCLNATDFSQALLGSPLKQSLRSTKCDPIAKTIYPVLTFRRHRRIIP